MSKQPDRSSAIPVLCLGIFYGCLLGMILERKKQELAKDRNALWEAVWDIRAHIKRLDPDTYKEDIPFHVEPIPVRIVVPDTSE